MTIRSFPLLVSLILGCFMLAGQDRLAAAETPDDRFIRIYSQITEADALKSSGKTAEALKLYERAYTALNNLKQDHPHWNSKVVSGRLALLRDTINTLSQPTVPPEDSTAGAATAKSPGRDSVKLLDAGSEPRQALRFSVEPGSSQTWIMSMTMAMDMNIGEMPSQSIAIPTMRMIMSSSVKSVSPAGDIECETVIQDVSVEAGSGASAEMVEQLKRSLDGFKGMTVTGHYTDRGVTKSVVINTAAISDPQLKQSLEQMKEAFSNLTSPFPEEPVGPGARWEASTTVKSQGMTIAQTARYELVSREGNRVELKYTQEQHAANQKIQNPALPSVKLDLVRLQGDGEGTSSFSLDRLVPIAGDAQVRSDVDMAMNLNGQKQKMAMKMIIGIKLQAAP